ncbi:hypothetical protein HY572_05820 [Candidatus Micrarchaeota archaeon]|nr:hypothetical protein [Candidatus Micrarchaeota archaeon]
MVEVIVLSDMNVILRGKTKDIVKDMVAKGFANSQSEAIRLAIISFGEKRFLDETALVNAKLDRIDRDIASGKRKLLAADQALGSYATHLK